LADLEGWFRAFAIYRGSFAGFARSHCPICTRLGGALGQGNVATTPASLVNQSDPGQPLLCPVVLLADVPACGLIQASRAAWLPIVPPSG